MFAKQTTTQAKILVQHKINLSVFHQSEEGSFSVVVILGLKDSPVGGAYALAFEETFVDKLKPVFQQSIRMFHSTRAQAMHLNEPVSKAKAQDKNHRQTKTLAH